MSPPVVSIADLRKTFGSSRSPALDGLNLDIPAGGVFGLLGPNGSGKTTTLRILFGLVRPDAGRVEVFGHAIPHRLQAVLGDMGCLIEGPTLFPSFSGRRNLEVLARIRGIGDHRVEEVLQLVGIADRASDAVRRYSLGMRQRLAIAAALLSKPRLLVLDEPSNGLDPAGMADMRVLIRCLAEDVSVTVVVASHLLGEMQQVCDQVAILDHGRLVAAGSPAELVALAGRSETLTVQATDLVLARRVIEQAGYSVTGESAHELWVAGDDRRGVLSALVDAQVDVSGIRRSGESLEDAFLALTRDATPRAVSS